MDVTINQEQKLFVTRISSGYSCFGFLNLFQELEQLLKRLGLSDERASADRIGTMEQYEAHKQALALAARQGGFRETWFKAATPPAVRKVLEEARKRGEQLRIFYGDVATGRDWCEEHDVIGRVSRSVGLMKIPLLLVKGEYGGGAISDDSIVKIQRISDGAVLYQHALYQLPDLEIRANRSTYRSTNYTHEAWREGKLIARFTSLGKAAQYVAFMHGECFRQPS